MCWVPPAMRVSSFRACPNSAEGARTTADCRLLPPGNICYQWRRIAGDLPICVIFLGISDENRLSTIKNPSSACLKSHPGWGNVYNQFTTLVGIGFAQFHLSTLRARRFMESIKLDVMNEEEIFEAEYREEVAPSRKSVVLRTKMKSSGKEKQANNSRFKHRTAPGFQAKNSVQRNR